MIRKLIVLEGRAEREIVLTSTVVVGRDPACQLSDLDPLLSRRHAEFVVQEDRAIIRDLKSRNGILVNGVKLAEHVLAPGDVVQLGHLHVRYDEQEPAAVEPDPRAHATTATGMAPTIAVLGAAHAPQAASPAAEPAAAHDDTLDVTTLPASPLAPPAAEPVVAPPAREYSPDDFDSTRLAASRWEADVTRAKTPAAPARPVQPAGDFDATMITVPSPVHARERPAPQAVAERPTEAWLVTDQSLTITEASPTCADLLGVAADGLVGTQLTNLLGQALGLVSAGSGPSPLSLSVERGLGGMLTITLTAGKATGLSS